MYDFIVCNSAIKIPKYRVSVIDESGELLYSSLCIYQEEVDLIVKEFPNSVMQELDTDNLPNWMDGIQVSGENPWEQAVAIYEMGEEAYKASLKREQATNPEQLRADLDYVMLMGGY